MVDSALFNILVQEKVLECLSNWEREEGLLDPSAVHRQTLWREISYRYMDM